jgi:4'-phosphopantetheinyl transferase
VTLGEGGGLEVLDGLHLAWARTGDLPLGDGWLSPGERAVLAGLGVPKRRADWRLGRWTAKRAVRSLSAPALGEVPFRELEVLADGDGRPVVALPGVHVSISHSAGVGYAAAFAGDAPVGCDVERIDPRSRRFVVDYFTDGESAAVQRAPPEAVPLITNLIWSAKESALKALGQGLRLDTRQVEVFTEGWAAGGPMAGTGARAEGRWHPLRARGPGDARFQGSWRIGCGLVWTVLTGR